MIPALLDPWLFNFSPDNSDEEVLARVASLNFIFSELDKRYPIRILPFISEEEHAAFWTLLRSYKGHDAMRATQWINVVEAEESTEDPARVVDTPWPDLSLTWLKQLAVSSYTDDPPRWRFPMVLIPELRKDTWPDKSEITFINKKNLQERNLVSIDHLKSHEFFERDIDPWRLKCIGYPKPADPLAEKETSCKQLPRPPQIKKNTPIEQLVEKLEEIGGDWTCGADDKYFYLPPKDWDPSSASKTEWRDGKAFPLVVLNKNFGQKESGYKDINNSIWVWDKGEKDHWDVKTSNDDRVARVSFDGTKKPL